MDTLSIVLENLPKLFEGALMTIELVLYSVLLGFLVAVSFALMRLSKSPIISWPAFLYVFFFRGTPLLVQLFLIYYGFAQIPIIRDTFLWDFFREPFYCALLALTLNTGAYSAEIFRGAIQAVPKGQIEAAKSVGMSKFLTFRRIIFPEAFRIALPAYGNETILLLKASALASTITIMELTGTSRSINARTFLSYEIFLTAGAMYLCISYVFTRFFRFLEKRMIHHPV